jgi:hypothetical protein
MNKLQAATTNPATRKAMTVRESQARFVDRIEKAKQQYRALLAPPGSESDDEAADIAEEFAPEAAAIETLPDGAGYSLLDDEPGEQSPETPGEEKLPAIDFHTGEVIEDQVAEAAKPEPPAPEESPAEESRLGPPTLSRQRQREAEVTAKLSADWPTALNAMYEAALETKPDLPQEAFDMTIATRVLALRKKGRETDISLLTRREWFDAMRRGTFDFGLPAERPSESDPVQ